MDVGYGVVHSLQRDGDTWMKPILGAIGALGLLAMPVIAGASGEHTPPPGSPERRAIFDATRKIGDIPDRVWVVRFLKVEDSWAWVSGAPQSPDGRQRYEPESALLHRKGGYWAVVDQPCAEEDCDAAHELARIRKRFPAAPKAIFAGWTAP
jgi:hypothetical protein